MAPTPLASGGWAVFTVSVVLLLIGGTVVKSKDLKIITIFIALAFLGGAIYMLVVGYKSTPVGPSPSATPSSLLPGGHVGPDFDTIPGKVTITGVSDAKSSPGVFISFTEDGQCSQCDAVFDMSMTYSDGTTDSKEVTTSVTSQQVYADYSPKIRPLPPGPVQLVINAFSINPNVSGSQGPKSAPYIQLIGK